MKIAYSLYEYNLTLFYLFVIEIAYTAFIRYKHLCYKNLTEVISAYPTVLIVCYLLMHFSHLKFLIVVKFYLQFLTG
jgi:hypothetical protein